MTKNQLIITQFGLFTISRQKIDFIHKINLGEFDEHILANSLPFGEPPNKSFKFSTVNGEKYLCYSQFNPKSDEGRGILINISFKKDLLKQTMRILSSLEDIVLSNEIFNNLFQSKKISIIIKEFNFLRMQPKNNHLDGILFALLAHTPLTIIGTHEQVIYFLNYFIEILPSWITDSYTFITQTNSLSENVKIVGLKPKTSILKNIENEKAFGRTIVCLDKEKVFAPFTSQFCRKSALLLKEDNFESFKNNLNEFHQLILQNSSIKNVDEAMKDLSLDFDNAQLFIALKAVMDGAPIDPKKFDQKGGF